MYLLAISAIGIFIEYTGLVPTKVSALGIEFGETNQNALLYVLALITAYFLAAFFIYATADFFALFDAIMEARRLEIERRDAISARQRAMLAPTSADEAHRGNLAAPNQEVNSPGGSLIRTAPGPVAFVRFVFEFLLPVIVSIFTMIVLVAGDPPPTVPESTTETTTGLISLHSVP